MSQDANQRFRSEILSELSKAQGELSSLSADVLSKRWANATESASKLNWRINQVFLAVGRHAKEAKK